MKNRIGHMILSAVLLSILLYPSCEREPLTNPEIMVSLYIPSATLTRAETGTVSPLQDELKVTSLQIWVFLSNDEGTQVSYKSFSTDLDQSGVSNSAIIRFGLPLTMEMFNLLTDPNSPKKVDVANAASGVSSLPGENTTRNELDQLVVSGFGGSSSLTMSVPEVGLPMSGVLKEADVTGGYPVLNIPTLKLTRAVSKIRFVFCQQGLPATETTPAVIANKECRIIGITFDGTNQGNDCQIASTERLFTTQSFDLGDQPGYTPLDASIGGDPSAPLIPNSKLSIVLDPEELAFRSAGNETEMAEHYESRLDAAIASESQVGPIYLRETDKTISGTILYSTSSGNEVHTAHFSMLSGDVFSRNHTWIVYACFVEETMKLELKVVVLPWEWQSYAVDYTTGSVNVVRRFTVPETPVPSFKKVQTEDGFYDVRFWHTLNNQENIINGDIVIATPVGGKLHVIPVPGKDGGGALTDAFIVEPSEATIYPNYEHMENGRIEDCRISIQIKCNPNRYNDPQLEGNYIDLHFSVETPDGRFVDLGSESIDYYRFILKENWNQ